MGLKKYIRKYKEYESKELARRVEKKKRLRAYIILKRKKIITKKLKRKFSPTAYTKTIGNPYGIKFPKAKKILKKVKKHKLKGIKKKVIIIYE